MKLESVLEDRALLYMERYVDEGAKTYSPLAARTEAAARYRPESDEPCFELVTVNAPPDRVSVFRADSPSGLYEHYVRREGVLFPVHPATWEMSGDERLDQIRSFPRGAPILAAPTASTRTVLTLEQLDGIARHFVKLHYPVRISRFNRSLRRKEVHNAVAATKEIADLRCEKFAYLPDALGVVFGEDDEAWGFLVREAVPRPLAKDRHLIPCFALYAGDAKHPEDPPLLAQIIDRFGAEPNSFAVEQIFIPLIEGWSLIARELGLILQSHAQNTLLEVDSEFRPRRIVHRDFDVWIDLERRRRAGLATSLLGGVRPDSAHPVEQVYSLVYDRFIGHEFFDYTLAALKRFYSIDENWVRRRVRDAFHSFFPDAEDIFPQGTTFYFSNEPPPGREYALENMHRAPVWR